ncbi:MAG: zinc metallopeptidase [Eubacteriales bacterium]|nr:zinc metallopeptidase [Eubacteriales bacterium]
MELLSLAFIYMDRWYFILIVPCILLSFLAQFRVRSAFSKFSGVQNRRGITGAEAAHNILSSEGIYNVKIEPVRGDLTDHYDPKNEILRLSEPVYNKTTIAALGVAAHEAGHAIQHASDYSPMKWRQAMYPLAGVGSGAGPYLAIFGLILQHDTLFKVGILLYSVAVLFYFVTLPVEFNASKRALAILEQGNYLTTAEEVNGARHVLQAAAMTYVASAATAFASMLRLILLNNDSRKNG